MSTERDELADLIWDNAVADRVKSGKDLKLVPVVRAKAEAVADAILAAGYRKPRTITTAEELDALPEDTVVLCAKGNPWRLIWPEDSAGWYQASDALGYAASDIPLPATLIHDPEAQL